MAVVIMLVAAPGQARERKLQRSELPPAVAATIDRETQGATIKGYATEMEHGQKVYEAETVISGHTRDIQIAETVRSPKWRRRLPWTRFPIRSRPL